MKFQLITKPFQRIKSTFSNLLAAGASPLCVAIGTAVGVLFGTIPIMGLQMLTAALLCFVIKGNKIAAIIGTWIGNPFLYYLNYLVGSELLPGYEVVKKEQFMNLISNFTLSNFLDLGEKILIPLFAGSMVIGLILSTGFFFLTITVYSKYYNNEYGEKL